MHMFLSPEENRSVRFFFFILAAACLVVCSCRQRSQTVRSPEISGKVDAYLQPFVEAGGFSGAVLIARGGRVLHGVGYGLADVEARAPATPRTRFRIASLSKSFTAAGILLLQERGALTVRDSLARFIPDYPSGDRITLHHLLTHTSGIPNVNNFPAYDQWSTSRHTLPAIISFFKDQPLRFEPGARYEYSNSNYNLLAYIIEKASGLAYGEFLDRNIFKPLGMADTGHEPDDGAIKDLAKGYMPEGARGLRRAPALDWSIKTGNGSLYSTIGDLYRWDRALAAGKILGPESRREMFKDQGNGVGYGWFVGKRSGRNAVRFNGRSPGYTSNFERYVDDDACIIVLSNNYAPVPHVAIDGLRAILFGEPYAPLVLDTGYAPDPASLRSFEGRFRFGPNYYRPSAEVEIKAKDGSLEIAWTATYVSSLRPLTAGVFLDRLFWATIIFRKDAEGRVTGLVWRDTSDFSASKLK